MKKNISIKDKDGIIVVRQDDRIFAVDHYSDTRQAEQLWRSWIDTFCWQADNRGRFTVADYAAPAGISFTDSSDAQVAFLTQNFKPERMHDSYRASYARINGVEPYDISAVDRLIESNPVRFRRYESSRNPLAALLNDNSRLKELAVDDGHFTSLQRLFQKNEGLSFVGKEHMVCAADVAWMFRKLEDKAVENSFAVLKTAEQQFVMHLGIGSVSHCAVDIPAIMEAAGRMKTEKVWFVHNHPSGSLRVSREDMAVHKSLKLALGDVLQSSVIINTDSGMYAVYDESFAYNKDYADVDPREPVAEVPVYTFDNRVFLIPGKERYVLNASDKIAEFISTQRLGVRNKYCVMTVDNALRLAGVYHLPHSQISMGNLGEIATQMVSMAVDSGGQGVVLYGTDTGECLKISKYLKSYLKEMTGGSIKLLDCLQIDRETNFYRSALDNGVMEPMDRYRAAPVKKDVPVIPAEVIRIEGGRALLRLKGEHQQPAVFLRKSEINALDNGKLTVSDLAEVHFPELFTKGQEQSSREGLRR